MITDEDTIKRISELALQVHAGNLQALAGRDLEIYCRLSKLPVSVKITTRKGTCEDLVYDICFKAQGRYESFHYLKGKINGEVADIMNHPTARLLTVLPDGIFVGEARDLKDFRRDPKAKLVYPIVGVGEKLAEVWFERT